VPRFLSAIFELPAPGGPAMWIRIPYVMVGLVICGLAFAIMLEALIGLDPWDAFHQGISVQTGIPIGQVVVFVGFIVMFFWIFLKQKLGLGTILNALTIGFSIDYFMTILEPAPTYWWGVGYFVAAILINGVGIAMYVGAGLGPGPRDGLMTGLVRVTGRPVWLVRTIIELVVLGMGWAFGGSVGLGTVLYAFTIGPVVHVLLPIFALDKKVVKKLEDAKIDDDLEGR
jgi:uncharacterized membrane protein YczE